MIRMIMIRTVIAPLALRRIINQAIIGPLEVYILSWYVQVTIVGGGALHLHPKPESFK